MIWFRNSFRFRGFIGVQQDVDFTCIEPGEFKVKVCVQLHQTVQFDLAALEAMPAVEFTTTTTWTDGPQTFTGVSLADFLKSNSLGEGTIRAYAINNYSVDIPSSDAIQGGPIIAYRRNGELMSVRDKGPLWIVYPYDSDPEYQSEVIYSRSIWQLDRLEFVE